MVGKTILHYKILEKLGEGGMGVVYKAEDLKLKRFVAIKFLPGYISGNEPERRRFEIEAQSAGSLNHPNIATIHAIENDGDTMFIVMEYIDGRELRDVVNSGGVGATGPVAPTMNQIINIATQIAEGLKAAHNKGIIHRDIKSANIMLTADNRIKIMDFGLAKMLGDAQMTKTGTTLGTAAYMSPEQAQGEKADNRSDLWSLGVVLFELIAGKQPFSGDYSHAVIYAIINDQPESLTQLRADVPIVLEAVVQKLLEKNPENRYQDADEVLNDLYSLKTDSGSGNITQPPATARSKKPVFSMGIAAAIGAVLVALIMFGILNLNKTSDGSPNVNRFNSIAVLPFSDLSPGKDQDYFCDGMTEEILTNLTRFENLKVIARTSVMQYKNTDKSIRQIAEELGVETVLQGSIRKFEDDIRVTAQLIDAADESHIWANNFDHKFQNIFELQENISQSIANALHVNLRPQTAVQATEKTTNTEAYEYILQGRYHLNNIYFNSKSPQDFDAAVKLFDKALEIDSTYADGYLAKASAYHLRWVANGFWDQDALKNSLKFALKGLNYAPNSSYAHTIAALAYGPLRQWEKSYNHLKIALRSNPNELLALHSAAFLYASHGMQRTGIRFFERHIELDPLSYTQYNLLAEFYMELAEFDEARKILQKLETTPDAIPPFITGSIINKKIFMAVFENRIDEAGSLMAALEKTSPQFVSSYIKAIYLAGQGKKAEALALSKNVYVYILLGMEQEAISQIKSSFEDPVSPTYCKYEILKNSAIFDPLRNDPAFIELLAEEKKKYEQYKAKYIDLAKAVLGD